jgi:hypothetical protein
MTIGSFLEGAFPSTSIRYIETPDLLKPAGD